MAPDTQDQDGCMGDSLPKSTAARRPPKADRRAMFYRERIANAPNAASVLHAAWEWLTAELAAFARTDPASADGDRRRLADWIIAQAERYHRSANFPAPGDGTIAPSADGA